MDHWHTLQSSIAALAGPVPSCVIACISVIALVVRKAWKHAAMLTALLLVAIGISVLSKIAFYAWDIRWGLSVFRGASGHAARAAALYPTFGWIVFSGSSRLRCIIGVAIGALIALAVTLGVIDEHMHTGIEALVGGLVGAAVPVVLVRVGELKPLAALVQAVFIASAIWLCAVLPSTDYDFEQRIADFSRWLH